MNNITNTQYEKNELTYKIMLGIFIFMISSILILIFFIVCTSLKKNRIHPI